MCLYPELILNPKYKPNKKNGWQAPPVYDERIRYVPIGCKNCIECRKKKARDWQVRLSEHIKTHKNGKFITLTFSNESIEKITQEIRDRETKNKCTEPATDYNLDNAIATMATRKFNERYRKKTGKAINHWLITELGHQNTEHIHLHGIIWTNITWEEITKLWKYGWIYPRNDTEKKMNYVNEKTINYIIKYVTKTDQDHKYYQSIILASPGIGNNYTKQEYGNWKNNKYKEKLTNETYRTRTGHKITLPIYYRNKIYSEQEREKLWIEKLNKEERWILGNKIDISKNDKEYEIALKYAQKKNKQLGYKDNTKNWEEEQYERQRRIIKQKERIDKTNTQ